MVNQEDKELVIWWLEGMIKTRNKSVKRHRRRYLSACRKMCMIGWYNKEEEMIRGFKTL